MTAAIVALTVVVAALGGTALVLWFRTRDRQVERRVAAEIDAAIEKFRAEAGREQLHRDAEDRKIIEEDARRDPPNSDLPRDSRDGLRERLLRAAQAAGGDQDRARLEELLNATDTSDPEDRRLPRG